MCAAQCTAMWTLLLSAVMLAVLALLAEAGASVLISSGGSSTHFYLSVLPATGLTSLSVPSSFSLSDGFCRVRMPECLVAGGAMPKDTDRVACGLVVLCHSTFARRTRLRLGNRDSFPHRMGMVPVTNKLQK